MSIIVRSETDASQFFCKLAELFEFLIEHFFKIDYQPQYMDPITSTHFSREQIEEASVRGDTTITNKEGTVISIDRVAPDLALTTFAALQIDIAQEVELLPTPLGEGAFAIVYEGVYKQEKVAVKRLLRCSTPEQQKRMFSEFRREVLTMSQLSHPNIVNLKGFSNTPPFSMVMELVPHGTLYEFLRRPDPIPWNLRIRIAYDIACAMHFLHSADPPLIHKDLKSPNVLMAGTKYDDVVVAKVADFGISGKLYANKFKAISAKEREVENPTWLAPEVVKTQPYTAAADVYPYGVMLWELCARTHPFDEFKCEFPTDLEDVITQGKRPTIPKDCPRAFEALIQDCWHDNPAQRPTFAQILARFPSIISEVAPGLPSLLARIKRDLNEFNKKSEAQRKARDVERQEKWKKMREEEMAREAERKRNAAISSSSGFSASEDLDSSTSMDESTEASEGREGRSASDSKSSEEIKTYIAGTSPAHSALPLLRDDSKSKSTEDVPGLRRSARANVLNYEMGTVYQKMSEVELKDLWIQRGIPLQDGISKDRLAEVLENDDQWLFNQRRFLFSSPPSISSGQANPLKVSGTGSVRATLGSTASAAFLNHTPIPNAVSIPSLYVINPQLTTNEIQERNDLIAKQEKALGEFLKQQETARMELHLKHNRAIESRQRAAAAAATPSTSTTASSTTPPTSGSSTPINTSTDSTAIAPTATGTSRISQLLSAFNQPQSTTQGGAATNSSTSPTPTPGGSNAKLSTPAGPPKNSASMPIVRTVPPRPASTPSPPGSMTIPNSASSSTASSESSASTTNQPSSTSPTTPQAKNTAPVAPVPSTSNTASSTTTTTSTKPALLIPTTSTALVVKPTGSSAPSSPMPSTPTAPSGPSTMTVNGSWSTAARTAGGSPNTAHWRRNPQYTLVVGPGGATVKLTMSQLPRDPLPYIAFYIFKSPEGKRVLDIKEKIYAPDHFVNKEAVEATCNFPEGTFSIMCASFQPETSDFTLMASGTGISSLAPAIEYHVTDISGSWIKGSLAGGCMNHPTWRSNPKFALKVTDTSNKTKITGTLIAQTEVGCGFYVFTASNQNVPIAKSGFTTVSVGHEFSLSAGDYVIVPTTYEFGKESAFEITLYSDKPVELSTL
jgi:serine/threonine protein kinase